MSAAQLAARLGLTRQAVIALERSELGGGIRLSSLRRAAEALDCRLVYALVPNASLEETVRRRAREVAATEADRVDQTMLLEAQRVEGPAAAEQLAALTESLIDSPRLWDDG
jgi:predicted DNA-binding mobile mystery protein A